MTCSIEKPGCLTPWSEINHLLAVDERFEVQILSWKGFVLAPKHSSTLAALLYLLAQQALPFCVQGKGTSLRLEAHHSLIISTRAFSQLMWYEQGVVEVGAGCSLFHLQQFLFERNQEMAFEENLWTSLKCSIGGYLLSGKTSGIHYREEIFVETLLGVELVTWEGQQIKWGGPQRSVLAAPALHKLLWGIQTIPGVILKVILKTYPLPQKRLQLSWSFREKKALWEHVWALQNFSCTWESLDVVLSGESTDQGFVFAQIAGLKEEIEVFVRVCPGYGAARHQGEKTDLKRYMKQQKLKAYGASLEQYLKPGEYLWHQVLDQNSWWLTTQSLEEKQTLPSIWKQRFWKSLY